MVVLVLVGGLWFMAMVQQMPVVFAGGSGQGDGFMCLLLFSAEEPLLR